jgi:hypothetical protein
MVLAPTKARVPGSTPTCAHLGPIKPDFLFVSRRWEALGALQTQPAQPEVVTTKTVRTRYLSLPGRLALSGRRSYLHLPTNWPWAGRFISMLERLAMLDVPVLAPM